MTKITFKLNGKQVTSEREATSRLLDVLREEFNLTGSKEGCGEGECGACSILFNNRIMNSCLVPLGNVHEQEIITIEGIKESKEGQLLKESYSIEGAVQCGICTPGMMIASYALLKSNPHPTEEEIRIGLSGNLCRCTGYNMIVNAVKRASKEGEGLW